MELLYYSAFSLLLIKYFSPLEPVRNWVITRLINFMIKRNWWFLQHVITVISCPYCFSSWFTFFMTFSVWKAALVGTLTMVVMYTIEALKKYLDEQEN